MSLEVRSTRSFARSYALSASLAVLGLAGMPFGLAAQTARDAAPVAPRVEARSTTKSAVLHRVMVSMRDGVRLATDVYLPSKDGVSPSSGRHPVLLLRTPYNRKIFSARFPAGIPASAMIADPDTATAAGYAVVYQDVRGVLESEGKFVPMLNETPDGLDTVAWIAKQPWSDGRVGTFGGSYMGGVQMLLASQGPSALVTAMPQVSAGDQFKDEWVYLNGVLTGTAMQWTYTMLQGYDTHLSDESKRSLAADYASLGADGAAAAKPELYDTIVRKLPLSDMPVLRNASWWPNWIANRDNRDYFKPTDMSGRFRGIRVPMLHVGGWYDLFQHNTIGNFVGTSTGAATAAARSGQRLIMGPWAHATCQDCPAAAAVDGSVLELAWMDRMFKGRRDPAFDQPVTLFVMGENRWRTEAAWPLPGTLRTRYYLHSGGAANTATGDGALSISRPGAEQPDRFTYDPRDPAPTKGGIGLTGYRATQNDAEKRPDVLVFSTPVLEDDVEVTGNVTATLYAATTATDTEWWAKLIDVAPDGQAYILNQGVVRARYRKSRTQPQAVEPGKVERYAIDLWSTSNVFKKGHRIRLEITSSNFPYAERNPNSFIDLATSSEKDFVVANQTVYHDAFRASFVELPIIPASRTRNWIATPFPVASLGGVSR